MKFKIVKIFIKMLNKMKLIHQIMKLFKIFNNDIMMKINNLNLIWYSFKVINYQYQDLKLKQIVISIKIHKG